MSDQQPNVPEANDDAALDAELAKSIADVQAGNALEPTKPESKTEGEEDAGEETPIGEDEPTEGDEPTDAEKPTGEKAGDSQPEAAEGEDEFRIPQKGKWETDEAYEKRVELFDLVRRRRAATTPEAKKELSEEISKAKGDLKTLGGTERFTKPPTEETPEGDPNPQLESDKNRAKELGLMTKEEVAEYLRQERITQEVQSDLKGFIEAHKELQDEDVREVFFDFVDNNYNWQGKTGQDFKAVLGMAYDNMFRPSETVQERVLKGANVSKSVNAMQFPGGTTTKSSHSPEIQKSIDELKATGMSEEKALELLAED